MEYRTHATGHLVKVFTRALRPHTDLVTMFATNYVGLFEGVQHAGTVTLVASNLPEAYRFVQSTLNRGLAMVTTSSPNFG
jgi:hypothetical protein